jgi:hypothetical protein
LVSSQDLNSLSKLTNLEKIDLFNIKNLDEAAVKNYSSMIKMNSISVSWCVGLSGVLLRNLVSNKEFLVQLTIHNCDEGISSKGFHCLTTLTNLTSLTINGSYLDDIGLNMICSSCQLVEYLDMDNDDITVAGLNNIHCLIHLKTLIVIYSDDDWLAKLSHNIALTQLDLSYSDVSNEGLTHLSSLVNLTRLVLDGCRNIVGEIASKKLAFLPVH